MGSFRCIYSEKMRSFALEYRQSLKNPETEDKVDLLLYRPLGFLSAKLAHWSGLSPTQVTLLGLLSGISAGFFFADPSSTNLLIAASLFFLSGVLDSADGQLARISGRSSPFGLVLDGLCDNLVFGAVYLGCCTALASERGFWVWPLAIAAGFCHSLQSALLDFYLREFHFFTDETRGDSSWNPSPADAKVRMQEAKTRQERFLWKLRFSWLLQQQIFSTRSLGLRQEFRDRSRGPQGRAFREKYRKWNLPLLRFWHPLGANMHTLGIVVFASIGRFDLYLFFIDLLGMNAVLAFASWMQWKSDMRLANWMKKTEVRN